VYRGKKCREYAMSDSPLTIILAMTAWLELMCVIWLSA
jgi:hypothetical protein